MSNFDELMQGQRELTDAEKKKAAFAKLQSDKRQTCSELTEKAIHDVVNTVENMRGFLTVMSRFEAYSLNNNLLIFAQKPTATKLKDFGGWKKEKKEGEQVTKQGSKSLMIFEPNKYTGSDGAEHRGYNIKQMFDVSDVVGMEPEPRVTRDMRQLVRALVNECPYEIVTLKEGYPAEKAAGAYYDPEQGKIFAKVGMTPEDIFTSVSAAIAHAEMNGWEEEKRHERGLPPVPYRTEDHEFQARCVTAVLCMKYNVSSDKAGINSIPPKYATMDREDIRRDFAGIHSAVKEIEKRMELNLNPPNREQNRNERGREER